MIPLPDWFSWQNFRPGMLTHLIGPLLKIIVPGAGAGAYTYRRWRQNHRRSHAQGWLPITPAIFAPLPAQKQKGKKFLVTIMYEYDVEGRRYEGRHFDMLKSQDAADAFVRNIAQTKVHVWYNPDKPSESVLDESGLQQLMPSDFAMTA